MGYSVLIGDNYAAPLASVGGMRALREFAETSLPLEAYPETRHLIEHGFSQNQAALTEEVSKAQKAKAAPAILSTLADLAKSLHEAPQNSPIVYVSDDLGDEGDV